MSRFLLWGLIFVTLHTLTPAKKNELHIKKVEIELDLFRGDAKITYNNEWKSEAEVLYAQKKKIVAYKDKENEWCLLEKIENKGLVNEEHYFKQFRIYKRLLGKDQLEKLAGKNVLTFCATRISVLLKPYPQEDRRGKSDKEERVKRELLYSFRGNESEISHQEISKKLLEDLANAENIGASRTLSGKGLKRNVDGKTENFAGHYPSSSAKVAQSTGVDYHTHIRNNIFPGSHGIHPIDITSSVTISAGSSHKIWSYPSSSGNYNTTAIIHPSGPSDIPHSSHQNSSRDISSHGVQHIPSLLHPYSSLDQSQRQGYYSPSAHSKSQKSPVIYPPSSTSKTQSPAHYPPSSTSKTQSPAHYPPSSTSKTQSPAHYPPSSTSKTQSSAHYPPSSVSKTQQSPAHYPPSAATKSQRPSGYFPPSSMAKAQSASHYPPSATTKYQPTSGHYPPSSSSKSRGSVEYPPSPTSKSQYIPAYYPPSSSTKPQQSETLHTQSTASKLQPESEHYPPSTASKPQYYPPSSTEKSHHSPGHFPPSSASKAIHLHYPPPSTAKSHQPQQNITTGSPSGGERQYSPKTAKFPAQYSPFGSQILNHFATPHVEQPTYIPPSSTHKVHHQPRNGTHFQYNTLYSYGRVPGVYAPQFPPSSTSKIHSVQQQFPSPTSNVNYVSQSHDHGAHHREYPHSSAQYPLSSSSKFHTKLDQTGGHTPHFPPSSASKIPFHLSTQDSFAPVLERPSAGGNTHEHENYPPSSSAKVHTGESTVSQYPPSSTSKAHYVPSSGHFHGGTEHGHTYPPSGSIPPTQIPQIPVSGHFPSPVHVHGFPSQYYPPYYPPSASSKQSHSIPHSEEHQQVAYYPPSSTAKFYPTSKQNATSHLLPTAHFPPSSTSKFQPSSIGSRHDSPSGHLTPTHVPYYPPSTYSKSAFDQGAHFRPEQHPYYPPSSSPYYTRNESSTGLGKSSPSSSGGRIIHSQPQYPPSSSSKLHPNGSEISYTSHTAPLYPSGAQHYPIRYNVSSLHHSQYQQPNIDPQTHHTPQFQQGSTRPCQGSLYSITTRTIVTPNGLIQRPVSVRSNGESSCGKVHQGIVPHNVPCSSINRNGQSIRTQGPCLPNHPNQPKLMRSVLAPGSSALPDKTTEQSDFGNWGGIVITNVGESEAEVMDELGYPVSHQQFSHLKENSTSKEADFESDENETKLAKTGDKEKVEDMEEETFIKGEGEEEEVKEGDVLEPGDRILGKNGYTISEGFRGRVVSVSGQVGKTRTTKTEKKSSSAQFRYSSELGRYAKDEEGKRFSDCQGEVTFTCSEFQGSNGRAKICKPNPRRNPDGSPC